MWPSCFDTGLSAMLALKKSYTLQPNTHAVECERNVSGYTQGFQNIYKFSAETCSDSTPLRKVDLKTIRITQK
jgi:hypothetical protein